MVRCLIEPPWTLAQNTLDCIVGRFPRSSGTPILDALPLCACRLNASHAAAGTYISQFPSPGPAHAAKFVAFIAGSFAALLLAVALVEDTLLERHLYGHTLARDT